MWNLNLKVPDVVIRHIKRNCRLLSKYQANVDNFESNNYKEPGNEPKSCLWILDYGVSCHMCSKKEKYLYLKICHFRWL